MELRHCMAACLLLLCASVSDSQLLQGHIGPSGTSAGAGGQGISVPSSEARELRYDFVEPSTVILNLSGDTVCVLFPGVPGTNLDSIRVGLYAAGLMKGAIFRATGVVSAPLGSRLSTDFSVVSVKSVVFPCSVPFDNWSTVDLRMQRIDAGTVFAVAMVCEGTAFDHPRLVAARIPSPDTITSLTYATADKCWRNYQNSRRDSAYIYLIRAYVSTYPVEVGRGIPERPTGVHLLKTYPNPANPTAVIGYSLTEQTDVQFVLCDLLGRTLRTIDCGRRESGHHSLHFNCSNFPSGVYFIILRTGIGSQRSKFLIVR